MGLVETRAGGGLQIVLPEMALEIIVGGGGEGNQLHGLEVKEREEKVMTVEESADWGGSKISAGGKYKLRCFGEYRRKRRGTSKWMDVGLNSLFELFVLRRLITRFITAFYFSTYSFALLICNAKLILLASSFEFDFVLVNSTYLEITRAHASPVDVWSLITRHGFKTLM
jgi:hypothetical protein